jgi:hypothetical protein
MLSPMPGITVTPYVFLASAGSRKAAHLLDASDETCCGFSIVLRYVCKDLGEVGRSAALIPELHALR